MNDNPQLVGLALLKQPESHRFIQLRTSCFKSVATDFLTNVTHPNTGQFLTCPQHVNGSLYTTWQLARCVCVLRSIQTDE